MNLFELFKKFDVFYVCFDEPNRKENWRQIQSIIKNAKKVEGVVGFDKALKTCARSSSTDYFFVIDGDNKILESRLLNPFGLSSFQNQWVLSWSSLNSINGLIYGNGGLKFWPKKIALEIKSHENSWEHGDQTDYCFLADYYLVGDYVTETIVNSTAQQAFRSGFREGVKMSLQWGKQVPLNKENFETSLGKQNRLRLKVWCQVGADASNGYWAILGARLGLKMNVVDLFDHRMINSYSWIDDLLSAQVLAPLGITLGEQTQSLGFVEEKLFGKINELGKILNEHLPLHLKLLEPKESLLFKENFVNPSRSGLLTANKV